MLNRQGRLRTCPNGTHHMADRLIGHARRDRSNTRLRRSGLSRTGLMYRMPAVQDASGIHCAGVAGQSPALEPRLSHWRDSPYLDIWLAQPRSTRHWPHARLGQGANVSARQSRRYTGGGTTLPVQKSSSIETRRQSYQIRLRRSL